MSSPAASRADVRFDGQAVIVTGAGRGLGRAYAELIASRGATVVVHDAGVDMHGAHGDPRIAEEAAGAIAATGATVIASTEDLATRGGCEALVRRALERFGRIDALVHNAGIAMFRPLAEIDAEEAERLLAVNVDAALWLARAALPAMYERGYGRIVFTVSKHGLSRAGARDLAAYSVGKASQAGLTYALADETEGSGVLVNAIAPIAVTRTSRRTPPPPDEFTVAQVAPAVAFLASSACTHSGVIVHAENGRFSAGRYVVNAGIDMGHAPTTPEAFRDRWDEVIGEP